MTGLLLANALPVSKKRVMSKILDLSFSSEQLLLKSVILHLSSVRLKFSGGAGVVTPSKPLPPTNNFCLYPSPVLRWFWRDPAMTPPPHFNHLSLLPPCPFTTPIPLIKSLIIHQPFLQLFSSFRPRGVKPVAAPILGYF